MLSLFFRKNFYDGWDNVMFILVPNFIIDAVIVLCALLAVPGFTVFRETSFYLFIWIFLFLLIMCTACTIVLSWADSAYKLADYQTSDIKDFFKNIPHCIKDGVCYGLTLAAVFVIATVGALYFFKPSDGQLSFAGLLAGACYVWCALIVFMALCWYPAIRAVMHNEYAKSIKKCFIVLFDNLIVSVVVGLYNVFLFVISVIMLGVAPGAAGLALSRVNAFRLILKKYDYIEELDKAKIPANSPERRKIPWKDILAEENEANPVRGFKAFIMPWKE